MCLGTTAPLTLQKAPGTLKMAPALLFFFLLQRISLLCLFSAILNQVAQLCLVSIADHRLLGASQPLWPPGLAISDGHRIPTLPSFKTLCLDPFTNLSSQPDSVHGTLFCTRSRKSWDDLVYLVLHQRKASFILDFNSEYNVMGS